jgi:enoyl-CoA hydratase/carnithine racemase
MPRVLGAFAEKGRLLVDAHGVLKGWRDAGTLWLQMNRPAAMNALSPDLVAALSGALSAAAGDPGVRVVVLTGSGRAFCAGADLKHVQHAQRTGGLQGYLGSLHGLFEQVEASPQPVVAAVNGVALAGGLELLLCCDLVVAARSARLGDGHANVGLLPGGGATARLPRAIGLRAAKELLYTGDAWPAEAFHRLGLVNQLVEGDELESVVTRLAHNMGAKSPSALAGVKALVQAGADLPLQEAVRRELLASVLHAESPDAQEGVAAFEAKRPPIFGVTSGF